MGTVLIPIPDRDFDPTEVAVSWQVLRADGHRVVFATESGAPGVADDIMVTGRGLDFWSAIPVLGAITVVGGCCGPTRTPAAHIGRCCNPPSISIRPVGDHARRHRCVAVTRRPSCPRNALLYRQRDAATPCRRRLRPRDDRGRDLSRVLLAARSVDPTTGHSVLYGRRTTALTWALERTAWRITRITRFWDSQLLPHLHRGARAGRRVHVSAVRSHPCPEKPDGLL